MNRTGVAKPGWRLETTPLPEQQRKDYHEGKIREIREGSTSLADWQNLLLHGTPIAIPPRQKVVVLWDLETYLCGYPLLETANGEKATVAIEWAESLYAPGTEPISEATPKGNRNETLGKRFIINEAG